MWRAAARFGWRGGFWTGRRHTKVGSFARSRRRLILGPVLAAAISVGIALVVGPIGRSAPIVVRGSITQCSGLPQPCEWAPAGYSVTVRQLNFPWRTAKATTTSGGQFSMNISPGRYQVSIAGCKTYGWPGNQTPQFELRTDGSVDADGYC